MARELGESEGPLVLAGASTVHTNSLDALVAAHYLNLMLGASAKPGTESKAPTGNVAQMLEAARIVFLDGEILSIRLAHRSDKDFVVSFSNFVDDSTAFADVLLPDHHSLEWEAARRIACQSLSSGRGTICATPL